MILAVIVEDDPMVMEINHQYMKKIPEVRVVACCRNGSAALEYLTSHKVDLILMDMYMPEMTGLEVLRKLRTAGNHADVIMVTADNSAKDITDAMSLGIIDYLIKPFEFERFRTAIQKCVARKALSGASKGSETLSQEDIDKLLHSTDNPSYNKTSTIFDKGIQANKLEVLIQCLSHAPDDSMLCETLAAASGLSKVTVRRYMNYLIENDQVESITDYRTGGRPAVRYRIKTKSEK